MRAFQPTGRSSVVRAWAGVVPAAATDWTAAAAATGDRGVFELELALAAGLCTSGMPLPYAGAGVLLVGAGLAAPTAAAALVTDCSTTLAVMC